MINICVIEDNKRDYNDIIQHLKRCMREIRNKHGLEISVMGIQTPNHSFDELIPILKENEINILILDYELKWKGGRHFNGLNVLTEIIDQKLSRPFVFFTSGLFKSNPEYVGNFVIDGYSEEFNSRTLLKGHFFDDSKVPKTTKFILETAPNIASEIEFDLYSYPLKSPKKYARTASNLTFKTLIENGNTNNLGRVKLLQDDIICIIISSCSKKLLLITAKKISSLHLNLLKEIKDYTIRDLENKISKHNIKLINSGKKFIYNPLFIEPYTDPERKKLEFHLREGPLLDNIVLGNLLETIEDEIDIIEKVGEKDGKVKEACKEINPFYEQLIMIK